MNLAQTMLSKGAAVLMQSGAQAEQFTLEGETVWANCNRTPRTNDPQGMRDVSTRQGSVIEWPLETLNMPEVGSEPVDSRGFKHRVIRPVQHIGHALKLECEVLR